MSIRMIDVAQYTKNAPPFVDALHIVQSGVEDTDLDVKPIVKKLHRLCESTEGLSSMLITSTHDSHDLKNPLEKEVIRTGKRGRPKVVTLGTKVEKHYHALIVNENSRNDIEAIKEDLTKYLRLRRKKRPNLKQQKIKILTDCLPIVAYMLRQMDETKPYQSGTFDFAYFNDLRYARFQDVKENIDDIL